MNSFSILITCNYVFDHLSSMNAGVFFGFARQIHIAFLVKKALITFNFDLRILGAYKSLKSSPQCFPDKKKKNTHKVPSISTVVSSFLKALLQKYLSSCGLLICAVKCFSFCFMTAHKTSHFFCSCAVIRVDML